MKDLAPNLTRQRLLIEGFYKIKVKNFDEKKTVTTTKKFFNAKKIVHKSF